MVWETEERVGPLSQGVTLERQISLSKVLLPDSLTESNIDKNTLSYQALCHKNKPKVYVIHENDKWMEPLRNAFIELGMKEDFVEWNFSNGGEFDFSQKPPLGIFYNRISPSSHTRGHRFSCEHTSALLEWLSVNGRRIINGKRALQLELSKAAQSASFSEFDISFPKTVCVTADPKSSNYSEKLVNVAKKHFGGNQRPDSRSFIIKDNRSGRGVSVRLFNEVKYFEKYLNSDPMYRPPIDGMTILQQYVTQRAAPLQQEEELGNLGNTVIRCEFVGGRFLYAVKVSTADGFELCPADNCSSIQHFKNPFQVVDKIGDWYEDDKSPEEHYSKGLELVGRFERFLRANDIDIAGIEFVVDSAGVEWAIDLNMCTNYNAAGEVSRFSKNNVGMLAVASFLKAELASYMALKASQRKKKTESPANWFKHPLDASLSKFGEDLTEKPSKRWWACLGTSLLSHCAISTNHPLSIHL